MIQWNENISDEKYYRHHHELSNYKLLIKYG